MGQVWVTVLIVVALLVLAVVGMSISDKRKKAWESENKFVDAAIIPVPETFGRPFSDGRKRKVTAVLTGTMAGRPATVWDFQWETKDSRFLEMPWKPDTFTEQTAHVLAIELPSAVPTLDLVHYSPSLNFALDLLFPAWPREGEMLPSKDERDLAKTLGSKWNVYTPNVFAASAFLTPPVVGYLKSEKPICVRLTDTWLLLVSNGRSNAASLRALTTQAAGLVRAMQSVSP